MNRLTVLAIGVFMAALAGDAPSQPPPEGFVSIFNGRDLTGWAGSPTYWKVENGLRLTGMPGFKQTLSPEQVWQVTLLVSRADKLPSAALAALTEEKSRKVP